MDLKEIKKERLILGEWYDLDDDSIKISMKENGLFYICAHSNEEGIIVMPGIHFCIKDNYFLIEKEIDGKYAKWVIIHYERRG